MMGQHSRRLANIKPTSRNVSCLLGHCRIHLQEVIFPSTDMAAAVGLLCMYSMLIDQRRQPLTRQTAEHTDIPANTTR